MSIWTHFDTLFDKKPNNDRGIQRLFSHLILINYSPGGHMCKDMCCLSGLINWNVSTLFHINIIYLWNFAKWWCLKFINEIMLEVRIHMFSSSEAVYGSTSRNKDRCLAQWPVSTSDKTYWTCQSLEDSHYLACQLSCSLYILKAKQQYKIFVTFL